MNQTSRLQPSQSARAAFEAENLPFPPIPESLAVHLAPYNEFVFATRPLANGPYAIESFVHELERKPDQAGYAVVGFDGHGINSWAAHCYVVSGPVALFIQLPWGGAFTDVETSRAEIVKMFDWSRSLQELAARADAQGKIPKGWRLAVVATQFGTRSGWCWLKPGADAKDVKWNPPNDMQSELTELLSGIVSGKVVL
jgi:hypothetical protein